jgi:hypothetical protein
MSAGVSLAGADRRPGGGPGKETPPLNDPRLACELARAAPSTMGERGQPRLVIVVAGLGAAVPGDRHRRRLPRPPLLNLSRPPRLPSAAGEEAQEDAAVPEDREVPVVPALAADSGRPRSLSAVLAHASVWTFWFSRGRSSGSSSVPGVR